ncbi:MAG: ATP synthase F1 subunit epsilon [Ignavibacteriaceae bacterium]
MADLFLEIVTPSKSSFSGDVISITIPGTIGSFQVLKNHAPIISTFEIGIIKVELINKTTSYYSTSGGTVEVLNNKVKVLADTIEHVDNIDLNRAKLSSERAKHRLENRNKEDINIARAEAALARATNRIKVVEKYHNDSSS